MPKPSHSTDISKLAPRDGKAGRLGIVTTPIGNLGDMTPRAIEWLKSADLIACEDTRVSGRLLKHFGIDRPLLAYHEHNAERVRPRILARLADGESVALISDAGMPLVNDPGYKLVAAAIDKGIDVTVLPGASAVLSALVLSGLPTDRFLFAGFLPHKRVARRKELTELASVKATLILFETAPRLADALSDMADILGERNAAVLRELTKMFEEARRGTLLQLARHYAEAGPPKGEIVVVIAPPSGEAAKVHDLDQQIAEALARASLKDAVAEVAALAGVSRRDVYKRALAIVGGEKK